LHGILAVKLKLMENRKKAHLDLAFESQLPLTELDARFFYEPMLSGHDNYPVQLFSFLDKRLRVPIWVSSMTGGTELALKINQNLARACKEFGMGMGLGSCRVLMDDNSYFEDFNIRPIIGNDLPLFANLGISQIERLVSDNKESKAEELVKRLQADGLIIHVNPMQEWLQPEGDKIMRPPIETIKRFMDRTKLRLIVKEVGQGMGPESLLELMKLPLAAIEFGAFGGTNFARLELMRAKNVEQQIYAPISAIGHSAEEMVSFVNNIIERGETIECRQLIVSGGIKSFLDGYYLIKKIKLPALYGQASSMLKYAREDYGDLQKFVDMQIKGLKLAYNYLVVR
jgi:isopentenyl-diphosphate delta-isomerase